MKIDPYGWEQRLKAALNHLRSNKAISEENKKTLLEFAVYLQSNLSLARVIFHLIHIEKTAGIVLKDFSDWTKRDVELVLAHLNQAGFDEETKHGYRASIKKFFRWQRSYLERMTENGDPLFPPEVAWIKLNRKNNQVKLMPSMLLTDEELKRLIQAARGLMEKAFVVSAGDGGWRPIEHLTLTVGAVQFDRFGGRIMVGGKVNPRAVRVVAATPALKEWLTIHPRRKEADAPLWLDPDHPSKPLAYEKARYMLKRIAKEAGIERRVYLYLFRHSCVTAMAHRCSDAELKEIFGWTQGTKMLARYIHMSGRDTDTAALAARGIQVESEEGKPLLTPPVCRRCGQENPVEVNFCLRCSTPLRESDLTELDRTREVADEIMSKLLEQPEVQDAIRHALIKTGLWSKLRNLHPPTQAEP